MRKGPSLAVRDELTEIHIDLPYNAFLVGEFLWAFPLGGGLYELRSVPVGAYDLNLGDVVRATPPRPGRAPEIRAVVARSGHTTLRVFFAAGVPEKRRIALVRSLGSLGVSFERASASVFALDAAPEADLDEVQADLDLWVRRGWALYESCEARVEGSFDDLPEEITH